MTNEQRKMFLEELGDLMTQYDVFFGKFDCVAHDKTLHIWTQYDAKTGVYVALDDDAASKYCPFCCTGPCSCP